MIDRDAMIELLNAAVERKGSNFNYYRDNGLDESESCQYVLNGEPGCIIGNVIIEGLGVDLDRFCEGMPAQRVLKMLNDFEFSQDALILARGVQWNQDQGHDWGVAVEYGIQGEAVRKPRR